MCSLDRVADEPTQKTQPKTDAEPVEIPIPTSDQIISDFTKIATADTDEDE